MDPLDKILSILVDRLILSLREQEEEEADAWFCHIHRAIHTCSYTGLVVTCVSDSHDAPFYHFIAAYEADFIPPGIVCKHDMRYRDSVCPSVSPSSLHRWCVSKWHSVSVVKLLLFGIVVLYCNFLISHTVSVRILMCYVHWCIKNRWGIKICSFRLVSQYTCVLEMIQDISTVDC